MYRDYAINRPTTFPLGVAERNEPRERDPAPIATHAERGSNVALFVRRAKTGDIGTEPYTCLGTAQFESATAPAIPK